LDPDSTLLLITPTILTITLYFLISVVEGYSLQHYKESSINVTESTSISELRHPFNYPTSWSTTRLFLTIIFTASVINIQFTYNASGILTSILLIACFVLIRPLGIKIGLSYSMAYSISSTLLWPLATTLIPILYLSGLLGRIFINSGNENLKIDDKSTASENDLHDANQDDLEPHEQRMISSILQLDDTTSREVMVTRMDIVATDQSTSLEKVAEIMSESGHSRIPIYADTIDNIVGIVHSRDMLRHLSTTTDVDKLRELAHPSFFIPESKRLDELLRDFQEKHIHMAIVIDEYGGTAGLITLEDLLEEIVGEIEDEFDVPESLKEIVNENEAIMDARISLDEVNDTFGTDLQGYGFDTLGGLLYQKMGRIPIPGDQMYIDQLDISIISTLGRRIKRVRVSKETQQNAEHK